MTETNILLAAIADLKSEMRNDFTALKSEFNERVDSLELKVALHDNDIRACEQKRDIEGGTLS